MKQPLSLFRRACVLVSFEPQALAIVAAGGDGVRRDVRTKLCLVNLWEEVFSHACETRNLCKRSSDQAIEVGLK